MNLKTKAYINSLSIKLKLKEVTLENVPKNPLDFSLLFVILSKIEGKVGGHVQAHVIAAVMYFAFVDIDRHCKII